MNQFSQQFIRQFKKDQNFPSGIVDKDCLVYKELIFEENNNSKGLPGKNLSECFIIESSGKEEENKPAQSRGWKGNESNKKPSNKNNNNNSAASGQTGWKSSKYVSTETQEKDSNSTQSQLKNTEEKNKQKNHIPNKDQKQITKTSSSNFNNNADAVNNKTVDNSIKDEIDSDEYDGYFMHSNNSKNKTYDSNLEKELDKNVKSIIKNAMEDEESNLNPKECKISESSKKIKKKKKKNKNKSTSAKETDSKANVTINSEKTEQSDTLLNLNQRNSNANDISSTVINESDLSLGFPKQPFIAGPNLNFANYAMMNNNNNNTGIINSQLLNDSMLMHNPQNFQKQIQNNNNNNNNFIPEDSILNNSSNTINSNANNNQTLNQTGIPMFPPNLLHPMQPGIFLNPNAPKVIYPQIDPTKNLNFFIPSPNIFHPNLILEPVEIENIFKLNKKFNIPYEQSLWYIFNPLNASMSLPLSSKQIHDMYNMKLINGEVDLRPVDVFQFKSKSSFAFSKLKMLNDPNWVEDLKDSALLQYSSLNEEIENLKNEIENERKEKEKFVEDKNRENRINNDLGNGNSNNINNNFAVHKEVKEDDENFEVVGGKKGKNAFGNVHHNNVGSHKAKKPVVSQAAAGKNSNFVPAANPVTVINKNDFNSVAVKHNTAKPPAQNNATNTAKNVQNPIQKPNPNVVTADETLLFSESIIQAKGFENNNNQTNFIADNKEIIDALGKNETAKDEKKQTLNNLLIDAEEDWEVVDKRKKTKQNKEKEKANTNIVKAPEIKEDPKPALKKQEDPIDIVEKLKMNNPYFQNKEATKPLNTIDSLLNNNKFEVVVKKKKKKDDGKSKPPGMK